MANQNEQDIQQWMDNVARGQQQKKILIFDKNLKKLVAVSPDDPRLKMPGPDAPVPFGPEEAKRFAQ
ncbi:MAG TPA: hypothetical protein VJO32_01500 [Ktedonobacteraceae bacterium]|nr:hypothetical protein [Ktedonobacteraceae bacterium]